MKTTIDIPDDLFRKIKVHAAIQGRTMKEMVVEALQRELAPDSARTTDRAAPSLHDLMKDVCGVGLDSPPDLLTNPKYMDDFGR